MSMDIKNYQEVYRAFNAVRQFRFQSENINIGEFFVLLLIDRYPDFRGVDLAITLQTSQATVSHRLNSLEKLRYITRIPASDRRQHTFKLSSEAYAEIHSILEAMTRLIEVKSPHLLALNGDIQELLINELCYMARASINSEDLLVLILGSQTNYAANVRDLTASTGLRQPTVSQVCNRLQKQGLITKSRDDNEGRLVVIELTSSGIEYYRELCARVEVLPSVFNQNAQS